MERLTRKHDDGSYAVEMKDCKSEMEARTMLMDNFKKCCNKLGKLEDLEEEIGLPLEFILTKVIGHVIYTIIQTYPKDGYIADHRALRIGRDYDEYEEQLGVWLITTDSSDWVLPSEYGKTWWLFEEDAEEALCRIKTENGEGLKKIREMYPSCNVSASIIIHADFYTDREYHLEIDGQEFVMVRVGGACLTELKKASHDYLKDRLCERKAKSSGYEYTWLSSDADLFIELYEFMVKNNANNVIKRYGEEIEVLERD